MGLTNKLLPDNNCNWVIFQIMGIPRKPVLSATLLKEPYKAYIFMYIMYAYLCMPYVCLYVCLDIHIFYFLSNKTMFMNIMIYIYVSLGICILILALLQISTIEIPNGISLGTI